MVLKINQLQIIQNKKIIQLCHIVGQLDICLREPLTIDGVLEFRNKHIWNLSFGKMAGSL